MVKINSENFDINQYSDSDNFDINFMCLSRIKGIKNEKKITNVKLRGNFLSHSKVDLSQLGNLLSQPIS